jgi:hypothetical protein
VFASVVASWRLVESTSATLAVINRGATMPEPTIGRED